jgi:hypothetical protein
MPARRARRATDHESGNERGNTVDITVQNDTTAPTSIRIATRTAIPSRSTGGSQNDTDSADGSRDIIQTVTITTRAVVSPTPLRDFNDDTNVSYADSDSDSDSDTDSDTDSDGQSDEGGHGPEAVAQAETAPCVPDGLVPPGGRRRASTPLGYYVTNRRFVRFRGVLSLSVTLKRVSYFLPLFFSSWNLDWIHDDLQPTTQAALRRMMQELSSSDRSGHVCVFKIIGKSNNCIQYAKHSMLVRRPR